MPDTQDFPTTFHDELRREWTVKYSVPIVYRFCAKHGLKMGEFSALGRLDAAHYLELAYEGTRYQARSLTADESLQDFLEALEGPSFVTAQHAASNAVLNFTLATTEKERRAAVKQAMEAIAAAADELIRKAFGHGTESAESAPSRESIPTEPNVP